MKRWKSTEIDLAALMALIGMLDSLGRSFNRGPAHGRQYRQSFGSCWGGPKFNSGAIASAWYGPRYWRPLALLPDLPKKVKSAYAILRGG